MSERIAFVLREDLREPLVKSQVIGYLQRMEGASDFVVVSLRKSEEHPAIERDVPHYKIDKLSRFSGSFKTCGSSSLATAAAGIANFFSLYFATRRALKERDIDLFHARSYLPALICRILGRRRGVPFIFDMRALWVEESVVVGRVRRGSMLHRLLRWVERICLRDSAAVVSLTHAAVLYLQREYPAEIAGKPVEVIPTCADLGAFCISAPEQEHKETLRFGCAGTVLSRWFRLEWLAAIYKGLAYRFPQAEFEIVTRDCASGVKSRMQEAGFDVERLEIYSACPEEMPSILRKQTCNVMLYAGGEVSELGRSPTRLAEVLGCGRPVIANRGVGDVAEIVERYRVGVLMESDGPEELERVIDSLAELLEDPELPARCRRAAEEVFSLEAGTAAYRKLYSDILSATCSDRVS